MPAVEVWRIISGFRHLQPEGPANGPKKYPLSFRQNGVRNTKSPAAGLMIVSFDWSSGDEVIGIELSTTPD
jgi:hypothetical protein